MRNMELRAVGIASSPLQSSAAPLSRVVWIGREAAQALAPCFPHPQFPQPVGQESKEKFLQGLPNHGSGGGTP
ncbi:hypothetical protein PR202_gb18639 [Eleusine coracana subsp. coracana]|uniref:Uncharacterized protein n=1 Tax=Eleusine coracana subsp. coracana TaxID=191504 RepID=A0AAV5F3T4_ELECO|nr:hypothetical protein PR202_gb18639 [Eleusine coracana subsp. coracana]